MIEPPFLVSYAITRKCNLKCKHCYSDSSELQAADELSTAEAKRVLDDLARWGIQLLIFDGGEPLCRDDFFEIAKYATQKHLRTVVGTNGVLLDLEMANRIKSCGIQMVQIAIDGAGPETHDSFRGVRGAFEKTLQGVEACKKAGLAFQFGMGIRRKTLPEIPDMLQLAVRSGAAAAEFFDLVPVSRVKENCPAEVLNKDERRKIMEWLADAQTDSPIIIRVPGCPMYPLILKERKIQPRLFPAQLLQRIPYYQRGCAAGMPRGYVTILPNGDVIPCMLLQANLGNVREKSIIDIWNESASLSKLRSRNLLEGNCGKCVNRDVCAGCRGRAYEETHDFMASDSGCWIA